MTHHQQGEEVVSITAINVEAVKDYVSEQDTAKDKKGNPLPEATIWKLGAMDSYIDAHASSKATSYTLKEGVQASSLKGKSNEEIGSSLEYNIDAYSIAIEACRYCLKGWNNFAGVNGKTIKFKSIKSNLKGRIYDTVDPDLLAMIPKDIILELYVEIVKMSSLSEQEVKNSATG